MNNINKQKIIPIIHIILVIIIFSGCSIIKYKNRSGTANIAFTGDIMMHGPVKSSAFRHNIIDQRKKVTINNRGFDFLFKKITQEIKKSDFAVGNMEFPIFPPYNSQNMVFNSPPEVIQSLKQAGFSLMNIANNHILDQGNLGVISTINELKKHEMNYIGAGLKHQKSAKGTIIKIKGIKIGFTGYTGVSNYPIPAKNRSFYINWFYNYRKTLNRIKNMKKNCDYLVMVIHTGTEYRLKPERHDKILMKKYLNAGADLIIGHHPHVLQPVERIKSIDGRDCYIFYSLGNFISNQSSTVRTGYKNLHHSTRDSVIVELNLLKKWSRCESRFTITPIMTKNKKNKKNNGRIIQTVSIPDEIKRLKKTGIKNRRINGEIKRLKNKIRAIKYVMFGNSIPEFADFIETTEW